MSLPVRERRMLLCEVLRSHRINREIFRLDIAWPGPPPLAGQFFLLKPERTACFLSRPVGVALWEPAEQAGCGGCIRFMIALRGKGTAELAALGPGSRVELTGPLGNAWMDVLPPATDGGKTALIGGGIGIAPLIALARELADAGAGFDFYAGFKTWSSNPEDTEYEDFIGPLPRQGEEAGKLVLATEDGNRWNTGRIPDFFEPGGYHAVCACGSEPMLKAIAAKCAAEGVPCFISMERRMACGVGACLGCTVNTAGGNKRCCADGPVFPAEEVLFDD